MTEQEIDQNLIFSFVRGSHAYGLNNADSDEDIGSVAIPTLAVVTGFDSFEQKDDYVDENGEKTDKVVYNVMKALDLIENNNPNMLDFLYAPEHCIRLLLPEWERIMSVRDQFLCKKAKWAYQGYALSQLSRIETHRGYLLNPMTKPTREQFKLPSESIFPANQLAVIARLASDYIEDPKMQDKFYSDMSALFDHEGAMLFKKYINRDMAPFAIADFKQRQDAFLRTITSVSQKFLKEEYQDMARRELKFLAAEKQWTDYKRWDKERNPKRKLLEQKCGYDCYIDGTEFLTNNGWKSFDNINESDKLATINWNHNRKDKKRFIIEYQVYTDKFDGIYNGNMYKLSSNNDECIVTANHNMLYEKIERKSKKSHGWELGYISNIPDTFNILNTCTPNTKLYEYNQELPSFINPALYMRLMGWFLSDGTFTFKNNIVNSIRISQVKDGVLLTNMRKFFNKYKDVYNVSFYKYEKNANDINPNDHIEYILDIRNKELVNKLYNDCGHSVDKKIPRYVMTCSKRLKEILFDSMITGDGTIRNHETKDSNYIYYTNNKALANDVNELCFLAGWKTVLYGPYKGTNKLHAHIMYQIYVDKNQPQFKTLVKSKNISKIPVINQRIICFSVPNSTLVTRYRGCISMQGNCKHAGHLVRLLKVGLEIMEGKGVQVDRTNIDRDELYEIRIGNMKFDVVMQMAKDLNDAIEHAYQTNNILPLTQDPNLTISLKKELTNLILSKGTLIL